MSPEVEIDSVETTEDTVETEVETVADDAIETDDGETDTEDTELAASVETEVGGTSETVTDDEVEEQPESELAPAGDNGETVPEGSTTTLDTLREMQLQAMKMQLEQTTRESERWQKNHDKLTGRIGPQNQENQRLKDELARLRGGAGADLDYEGTTRQEPPAYTQQAPEQSSLSVEQSQLLDLRQRAANQAMLDSAMSFQRRIPNYEEFKEGIIEYVSKHDDKVQEALSSADPERVEYVTSALMQEGLMHAISSRIEQAATREKAQAENHRRDKVIATPSGTSKPKPTRKPPKPIEEMTLKELEVEYARQGRRGF